MIIIFIYKNILEFYLLNMGLLDDIINVGINIAEIAATVAPYFLALAQNKQIPDIKIMKSSLNNQDLYQITVQNHTPVLLNTSPNPAYVSYTQDSKVIVTKVENGENNNSFDLTPVLSGFTIDGPSAISFITNPNPSVSEAPNDVIIATQVYAFTILNHPITDQSGNVSINYTTNPYQLLVNNNTNNVYFMVGNAHDIYGFTSTIAVPINPNGQSAFTSNTPIFKAEIAVFQQ